MEPQYSIRHDIRIEDLNLTQLLQLSLETANINYYALALAKSRHAAPDQLSISLTLQLLEARGQKWAEVLERQAINDYSLVYSIACQNRLALDVLVGLSNEQGHKDKLKDLCSRILQQFEEGGALWSAFYVLLKISLQITDQQYKFQLLLSINRLLETKKLSILLQNLAVSQLNDKIQDLNNRSSVTFFHIYTAIIRLYGKCAKYAVKKGQLTILKNTNNSLANYFYEFFNNTLTYIQHYSSQNQARSQHQFKENLISWSLRCLKQLAQLPQLQMNFLDNQQSLVKSLISFPLLREAKSIQDRLNLQYGLSCGEFGEDIQSDLAQTILIVCSRVPGILKSVLISTRDQIVSQKDQKLVASGLVLLSVIGKLVVGRDDLVAQTVAPLVQYLISSSTQNFPLELKCRILRVLVFYGQIISEQQYHYLLTSILNLLCYQPCNSFAYHEADNIFQIFVQRSNTASTLGRLSTLIKQSLNYAITILLEVITKIRQVSSHNDQKSMRLVRLLRMLMDNNQRQVTEIAAKVLSHSTNWLVNQINFAWSQRMKHNTLIHQLAVLLKLAVQLYDMEQNYVNDASDQLYKVFQLLLNPERLQIVDEIVEMLALKIEKQAMMDGRLCQAVVTSLQCVVSYQKSNLSTVQNVLKALNYPALARQIIFEWGDLITYLASLYLNYFSNFLKPNYLNLYGQQFNQIGSFFEKFLQVYEAYFENNPQFRMSLLQSIRGMSSCEWRCRFFLILHHQDNVSGYDFFTLDQGGKCSKRGTMKLIFFYYIDKLLRSYKQNTLNELLQFNRIFEQKKLRRQFQEQPIQGLPFPQTILKTYLYEGFRELKKRNCIDLVQYTTIVQDFKLD